MSDESLDEQGLAAENERFEAELRMLGRDPSYFEGLLPDELNLRLKRTLEYVEDAREAEALGTTPPPEFLDPMSPRWIPDVEDLVRRSKRQLLGEDLVIWPEEALTDEEVERELHKVIDKLAEHGIVFGIREEVPERLAYRYLLAELGEGIDVMPLAMNVIDGCSGDCEECFQLPYCDVGQELAEEHDFPVPEPPLPPRKIRSDSRDAGMATPYARNVGIPEMPDLHGLLDPYDPTEEGSQDLPDEEMPF